LKKNTGSSSFSAKRNGRKMTITQNGISKDYEIDNDPWYQTTSVLTPFLNSSKKKTEFWVVTDQVKEKETDTSEFQTIKFVFIKQGGETVALKGKSIETEKVKMTFPGAMGMMWSAQIWFRKSDGVMVKSKMKRGGPWAPDTLTELISEN
jgi:hypothetical protein